jgi:hypothetical protein
MVAALLLTIASPALAAGIEDNLRTVGGTAYYDNVNQEPGVNSLPELVGNIINVVLGFLGIIFVIFIDFVSGFQWMLAGGNSDAINKAKGRMINAIIGLVIVLAAFSINAFVMTKVLDVTNIE